MEESNNTMELAVSDIQEREDNNDTMELVVSDIQKQEQITFNYEHLKNILTNKLEVYKKTVYTEETIALAKADRAKLNKLSDAINDEKKKIKNKLLEPYIDFETKCKDLMSIVDSASANVDRQIKAFEQKAKNEKLQEIMKIWIENVGEYSELIDFDSIYNPQWENKTYTISKIETDIKHIIEKTKMDISTIDGQLKDETLNKHSKSVYFNNIGQANVLSLSLQEAVKLKDTNQKIEQLENKEETKAEQTQANIIQLDFRVWATQEQLMNLKQFLKENKIKFGKVE